MKKTVVISDVARHAGVSTQTVSRVLNGHASVREETRRRVSESMKALNYRPNYAAQVLASGTSRSIAIFTIGPLSWGLMALFSELQQQAQQESYFVMVASAPTPQASEMMPALDFLEARKPAATVILNQHTAALPVLATRNIENGILFSSTQTRVGSLSTIGINQASGMRSALQHLWEQGVNDIVHVSGDMSYIDGAERASLFERYCRAHGSLATIVGGCGWGCIDGYRGGKEILSRGLPESIIAGNDKIALGCARALGEAGYEAGRDYRLIGCDDDESSTYLTPSLTTIRQDFHAASTVLMEEVRRLVAGEAPRQVHLDSTLEVRESSLLAEP